MSHLPAGAQFCCIMMPWQRPSESHGQNAVQTLVERQCDVVYGVLFSSLEPDASERKCVLYTQRP